MTRLILVLGTKALAYIYPWESPGGAIRCTYHLSHMLGGRGGLIPSRLFGMPRLYRLPHYGMCDQRMTTYSPLVQPAWIRAALVVLRWVCRYLVYSTTLLRVIVTDIDDNISLLLSASPPIGSQPYCIQLQLPSHPSGSPSHALPPLPWSCTPIHPD